MKLLTQLLTVLVLSVGYSATAQNYGKLIVEGDILCDKKDKSIMSSVTIYRYYHQSHSVELLEQQMIPRNGSFKFALEFDKDYVIDVASNTGIHKRVNLNTEVMKGYKYDNQKFAFEVDVQAGNTETPEEVAWIYFDPSKNDFEHSNQMPVAFEGR
jgi:hypothetical protein